MRTIELIQSGYEHRCIRICIQRFEKWTISGVFTKSLVNHRQMCLEVQLSPLLRSRQIVGLQLLWNTLR